MTLLVAIGASVEGQQPLTISIKEARKLLGKSGITMSDNQIVELILTLSSVADNFLQDLGSKNYTG